MAVRLDEPDRSPDAANDVGPHCVLLALTETSRIGGDSLSAARDDVDDWAAAAKAGESCLYAIGHLPGWARGAKHMRLLCEQGFVELRQYRLRELMTQYVAVRTARPWLGAVRPIRIAREISAIARLIPALLERLDALAEAGAPCPTNSEIAEELGITVRQAAYLFCCLEEAGAIRRELLKAAPYRVIIIVKTGRSTGR